MHAYLVQTIGADEHGCAVGSRFSDTYYHFLIEAMPRLALAKPILDADHHFRIISHEHDFARSFLAELGFDGERVVSTGITTKNSHHKVRA